MVVPEFRWPTTPLTFMSHSFWPTAAPCLGSAASSSMTASHLIFLPPMVMPCLFRSSMAMVTPLALSLP